MTSEEKIKAKIPGEDTGIEIKHSICDICSPGIHCGVDCYVKDGVIVKLAGRKGFQPGDGTLCVKGAAGRQYIYNRERIHCPMKRTGPRGSGMFEAISWEEAFAITARALNSSKEKYGPEATVFLTGYSKWYRPFLQRLAYSFGSPNYMTESSTCNKSGVMANTCIFGSNCMPDILRSKLVILWGYDAFTKNVHTGRHIIEYKKKGGAVIAIDSRRNPVTDKLADFSLNPRLGTDGYLALAMANYLIENDLYDREFVSRYVHGFGEFKNYVRGFTISGAASETGIPEEKIIEMTRMWAGTDPAVIAVGNGVAHHANGFDNVRAILSLMVIMGRYDRKGTLRPGTGPNTFCYSQGGFQSNEPAFIKSRKPGCAMPEVGRERFPLFVDLVGEAQAMELPRQIMSGKPYPIKTAFFAGVNYMMFPDTEALREAVKSLDFVAASDLFWTESCRMADIVFPACSSFERSEIKCYANKLMYYTSPAISPLFESRSDYEIIRGIACALNLDDDLLKSDYDTCARYILEEKSGITDWESFRNSDEPIEVPNAAGFTFGESLARGVSTPTGKLELFSETIAAYGRENLRPVPGYTPNPDSADPDLYPMIMSSGARNHAMIHSRLHRCSWARSVKPGPVVELSPHDAERFGIEEGCRVRLSSPQGSIEAAAFITDTTHPREVQMYHGYEESNVNQLIDSNTLDPYSGFPSYKQFRCRIERVD